MEWENRIAGFWERVQRSLFPQLEGALEEPLTAVHRRLITVLEFVRVETQVPWPVRRGRPRRDRRALARAFVAKACLNLTETKDLVERLRVDRVVRRVCGFETVAAIPSEATFSRAFKEFAEGGLLDRVHESLVKEHVGDSVTLHIARDATAIEVREQPVKAKPKAAPPKRKRGRPRKGEQRPTPEPTRLERQQRQSLAEAVAELPTQCDVGCKRNAKGHPEYWIGYKLHVDVTDDGIPVAALTTSASLHDSQVAIPLMQQTSTWIRYCYDVMDSAYDAAAIREVSVSLGHVPIIDPNPRGKEPVPLPPDRQRHLNARSAAERFNDRLKDDCGGRIVRLRGHRKVHTYLMCGVLVILAEAVLGLLT